MSKLVVISEEIVQAIGNYLATCPYNQVVQMMNGLKTAKYFAPQAAPDAPKEAADGQKE